MKFISLVLDCQQWYTFWPWFWFFLHVILFRKILIFIHAIKFDTNPSRIRIKGKMCPFDDKQIQLLQSGFHSLRQYLVWQFFWTMKKLKWKVQWWLLTVFNSKFPINYINYCHTIYTQSQKLPNIQYWTQKGLKWWCFNSILCMVIIRVWVQRIWKCKSPPPLWTSLCQCRGGLY